MSCITISTNLQVSLDTAYRVISNLQLLLKLSPHWDTKSLTPLDGNSTFEAVIRYYHDDTDKTLFIETYLPIDLQSYSFTLKNTIMKKMEISLNRNSDNSIDITQKYHLEAIDDASIIDKLTTELTYWHRAIIEYIKLQEGSGISKVFFRWFMDKVWLRLTLSERKIAIIVIKVSILEILVLIALIIGWRLTKI